MIPQPPSSRICYSPFTTTLTSESLPPREYLQSRCALASAPTEMAAARGAEQSIGRRTTPLLYALRSASFNSEPPEAPDPPGSLFTARTGHQLLQPSGQLRHWGRIWIAPLLSSPWGRYFASRLGRRMTDWTSPQDLRPARPGYALTAARGRRK